MDMKKFLEEIKILASSAFAEIFPLIKKLVLDLSGGLLPLAESALMTAVSGTPWPSIAAQFVVAAEEAGMKITLHDAMTLLSAAEANLMAKGTPAPVTLAAAALAAPVN